MVDLIGLEDRETGIPPCDSLAEAIVLRRLLMEPWLLDGRDIEPLLVFPEHRTLLAAMRRAARSQSVDPTTRTGWGEFFLAWVDELEQMRPGDCWRLVGLLDWAPDAETRWMWARHDEDRARDPDASLPLSKYRHDWLWWLHRLEDIHAQRRFISLENTAVQRAWKGDLHGARNISLQAIRLVRQDPGMDVPA